MKKLILLFVIFLLALSLYAEENSKFKIWGHATLNYQASTDDFYNQNDKDVNDFRLTGQVDLNAQYKPVDNFELNTTLVLGNYLTYLSRDPYNNKSNIKGDVYYINAKYIDKTVGDINAGRYGFKVNPYVFQRKWNDFYFENPLTQDGNFSVLGGNIANKNLNNFSYNVWYTIPQYSIFDDELLYNVNDYPPSYPVGGTFGLGKIKNFYGAELGYDFKALKLSALYSEAKSDVTSDKAKVYGAGLNVPLKEVNFNANYYEQKTDLLDKGKFYNLNLTGNFNKFNAGVEYMYVDPTYDAPGDWMFYGYGTYKDVKGFKINLGYKFDNRFYAYAEQDLGKSAGDVKCDPYYTLVGLNYNATKYDVIQAWYKYHDLKFENYANYDNTFNIKLRHDFGNGLAGAIGFEYDRLKLAAAGKQSGKMIYTQLLYSF